MSRIHVCYALNDSDGHYAKYIGTSIQSIVERTDASIVFHLLHDETLTTENRGKFEQLVCPYGSEIHFYDMPALKKAYLEQAYRLLDGRWLAWYSRAVIYRFCIWQILPSDIGRAIYLDADILFHMDIADFAEEEIPNCGLSAVGDIGVQQASKDYNLIKDGYFDAQRYFNSGVLLMERTKFWERNDWLKETLDFFQKHPLADFPDQDVMNDCFIHEYNRLPYRFNRLVDWERLQKTPVAPGIYHFSGHAINLDLSDAFNRLYFDSFTKTPWCDVEFLAKFSGLIRQTYDIRTDTMNQLSNLFARKKRVVAYEPEFAAWVRENVQLQPEEDEILCEPVAAHRDEFIVAMKKLRATHVFLIFSESYPLDKQQFEAAGLNERENFFDGKLLLPQREGGYLMDGYRAFRSM